MRNRTSRRATTEPAAGGNATTPPARGIAPAAPAADDAFDLWLRRGLRSLHGHAAAEPLPADLLRLLEAGREGSETAAEPEDR